ncbi:hypothetical protein Vretimale_12748 [Volvox reticuliferus]|uniref:Uncharacterized protein n=1 Tax=Volvox reticuliferus TaxID=1737510 RepID=A0A8J4CJW9_9CHLO|nr:hypothetical protein Vretifemale_10248 [Volvox reticuliferus]GIM08797.1 hypothetical protein Vretimale_12748 [Volvox reticuliferus]
MMRKRQPQAASKPAPSALGSWVSSDSHFVPAQRTPSDANPPPRPPVAKTTVASFLGISRPASAAGDAPDKTSSCGGSVTTSAAPSPAARSCSSIQLGDGNSGEGISFDDRSDAKSHQLAAAYSKSSPSDGGGDSGGQDFWVRRLGGGAGKRSLPVSAMATAAVRSSISGFSPTITSGLPETPCLRSPEWSPRRTSRSSGSAPSPLPAIATMAIVPTVVEPLPASPVSHHTCDQPYKADDGQGLLGADAGVRALAAPPSGDQSWGPGTDQASFGCDSKVVCEGEGDGGHGPLESCFPMAASASPPAPVGAPTPLGADPQELSLFLSMVAAVRSTVGAARDIVGDRAGSRQSGAMCSAFEHGAGSFNGPAFQSAAGPQRSRRATSSQAISGAFQAAAAAAAGDVATAGIHTDHAGIANAVLAAPTSILVLVLAVRIFRAALRWPVVASFCAAFTAWLGALLAFAAALFAAGRMMHHMAQVSWDIVAWVLGCRASVVTSMDRR